MTYTRIYHSPTKLPGGDGPIKLTKPKYDADGNVIFKAKEVVRLIPGTTYHYALASEVADAIANPPPPVVTPPVTGTLDIARNDDGSVYLRKDSVIVGISRCGGLRSTAPLPAGWSRTFYPKDDDGNQQERPTAALAIDGIEYIEMGAVVDGVLIQANGKTFRFTGVEGSPLSVIGKNDGQTFIYEDEAARYQIVTDIIGKSAMRTLITAAKQKLTGRRTAAFADLTPGNATPPTQITATAAIMGALAVTSPTPGAVYGMSTAIDPRSFTQIATKTVVAASKVRDNLVPFVGWTLPDLEAGQSDSVTWSVGVK